MTKPSPKASSASDKIKAILELLASGPRDARELATAIGCDDSFARRRLRELMKKGSIYRERVIGPNGLLYRWHLGTVPADAKHEVHEDTLAHRQITTRCYPVVGRRDPLVAALFGQPQSHSQGA